MTKTFIEKQWMREVCTMNCFDKNLICFPLVVLSLQMQTNQKCWRLQGAIVYKILSIILQSIALSNISNTFLILYTAVI